MKLSMPNISLGVLLASAATNNHFASATSSGRREYSDRNVQIKGETRNGKEMCWSTRNGKKYDKVVLARCDEKDDDQRFHIERYTTDEEDGRDDRPLWDDFYDAATVIDTCEYCDVGGWYVIRTKSDLSMVVTVRDEGYERAWLHLEKTNDNHLDLMSQVFFDLEGGELVLGDGQCDYEDDCLFVTTQGTKPNVGDPIMLRSGKSMMKFQKHNGPMDYWDPFGS